MFRRSIIISVVHLFFSLPKQNTLHIERETATFVFCIFLKSVSTYFVKYTWTWHLPYVVINERAVKVKWIRHFCQDLMNIYAFAGL